MFILVLSVFPKYQKRENRGRDSPTSNKIESFRQPPSGNGLALMGLKLAPDETTDLSKMELTMSLSKSTNLGVNLS